MSGYLKGFFQYVCVLIRSFALIVISSLLLSRWHSIYLFCHSSHFWRVLFYCTLWSLLYVILLYNSNRRSNRWRVKVNFTILEELLCFNQFVLHDAVFCFFRKFHWYTLLSFIDWVKKGRSLSFPVDFAFWWDELTVKIFIYLFNMWKK